MDFVKAQISRIQQQLATLTASQKMLAFALVAIMVMTMMWWAKYAGNSEMSAVLDQSFPDDAISRVTAQLSAKGIAHQVTADRKVLVPTDRKFEVLADLAYLQMLPQSTESGFESMITKMGPFDPTSKTDRMWNRALEVTLARVIGGFPGVSNASVTIDPRRERNLDGGIHPTATVNVVTRGATSGKKLADAAASVVSGAVAGMLKEYVVVIVDGATAKISGGNDDMGNASNLLELKQTAERRLSNKVSEQLSFIRGVIVSVTVDVETKSVQEERQDVDGDPKKTVHLERETTERKDESETTNAIALNGDAGTGANTTAQVPQGANNNSGGTKTTTEETKSSYLNEVSRSTQKISLPAGKETVLSATVRVPMSHFAAIWKRSNPTANKEPESAVLQPLVDAELPKIRNDVKKCTGLKNDDDVSVETYTDVLPMMATDTIATAGASGGITLPLGLQVKELAVGILAVASLAMMALMVRKGGGMPVPAARGGSSSFASAMDMPSTPPKPAAKKIETDELVAGEVGEGTPALDGMELDDSLIRARQVTDQVSSMVKENPDAAATMIKRWMQHG